jgi:hypothetical protein
MDGRRSRQLALSFLVLTLCGLTTVRSIAPARADDVTDWNVTVRNSTVAGIT